MAGLRNPMLQAADDIGGQPYTTPDVSAFTPPRTEVQGLPDLRNATKPESPTYEGPDLSGDLLPPPEIRPVFIEAAQKYSVPANVLMAIAQQESSYRPDAIGVTTPDGNAKGMMQYMDATAGRLGINSMDPLQSIDAAARQFQERINNGYTIEEAIMAHHGGDDRDKWGPKTRQYLQDVWAKSGAIYEQAAPLRNPRAFGESGIPVRPEEPRVFGESGIPTRPAGQEAPQTTRAPQQEQPGGGLQQNYDWGSETVEEGEKGTLLQRAHDLARGFDRFRQGLAGASAMKGAEIANQLSVLEADPDQSWEQFESELERRGLGRPTLETSRYFQAPSENRELMLEALETDRAALARQYSERQESIESRPPSAAAQRFMDAPDFKSAWSAFLKNPVEVAGTLTTESFGQFGPTLVAAGLSGPAAPFVVGGGSTMIEYNADIMEALEEAGADLSDPNSIAEIMSEPGRIEEFKSHAKKRAIPIGIIDAISMGIAGKLMMLGRTPVQQGGLAATEALVVQPALGASGEAAGSIVAGDEVSGKAMLGEALGEILPGAAETAIGATGQYREARAADRNAPQGISWDDPQPTNPDTQLNGNLSQPTGNAPGGPIERAAQETAREAAVEGVTGEAVTVTDQTGETVRGVVQNYQEDGAGNFTANITGADGNQYVFTQDDGVQITRDVQPQVVDLQEETDASATEQPEPEPEVSPEREQALPPESAESELVLTSSGTPFASYETAQRSGVNRGLTNHRVVQVEGGWALQPAPQPSRQDVQEEPEAVATPEPAPATQPDRQPEQPDIVRSDGSPFTSRGNVVQAIKNRGLDGYEPAEVPGGWVIRPVQPQPTQTEASLEAEPTAQPEPETARQPEPEPEMADQDSGLGEEDAFLAQYADRGDLDLDTGISNQPQKEAAQTAVRSMLDEGRITPQHAFRGVSRDELVAISETGRLQVGQDAEGQPGISATAIGQGDFPVYGDGAGIIIPPGRSQESGRASELLVDDTLDPSELQYVVDGTVMTYPEMQQAVSRRDQDGSQPEDINAADIEVDAVAQEQANTEPQNIRGEQVNDEWTAFSSDSGTINVPRAEMPQVKAEHRGALANYLKARGIEGTENTVPASSLKPTQTEFSEQKVERAKQFEGGDRAILVSSDGHILDGHHQWMARRDQGEDVRVIQLDAPISQLLNEIKDFPSLEQSEGATQADQEPADNTDQTEQVDTPAEQTTTPPIMKGDGTPFASEATARQAAQNRNLPDHTPVQVDGGWGLQPPASTAEAVTTTETTTETTNQEGDTNVRNETEGQGRQQGQRQRPEQVKPTDPISDFGEKIGGSRKDIWGTKMSVLDDDVDVASLPLSKSFPEPDYARLAGEGVDKQSLQLVALFRASIPRKPAKHHRAAKWAKDVETVRKFAAEIMFGRLSPSQVIERMEGQMADMANMLPVMSEFNPEDYSKVAKWGIEGRGGYTVFNGMEVSPNTTYYRIRKPDGRYTMVGSDLGRAQFELQRKIRIELAESGTTSKRRAKLSVYSDRRTKDVFIGYKGASGVLRLKTGFSTPAEARDYMDANRDDLEAKLDNLRKGPQMRGERNAARTGPDRREGDVTVEDFANTLGFRAVEFGNWVENSRRQADINEAYDAMIDLADVLGLPPRALSLDGSLAMAFGSRGRSRASAHYEPGKMVINLTKKKGPGSLGHEFFHAMDNYFGKQDAFGQDGIRKASDLFMSSARRGRNDVHTRTDVYDAFKRLSTTLRESEFGQRSEELDRAKSKPYWSQTEELAARAFEKYVKDRLADQGYQNDYLVNINEGDAYPSDAEMDGGIREAIDHLMSTIEAMEKEPGRHVLLSMSADAAKNNAPVTDTPDFKKWFKGSQVVDGNGRPLVVYHGTRSDVSTFEIPANAQDYDNAIFFTADANTASMYANGQKQLNTQAFQESISQMTEAQAGAVFNKLNRNLELQEILEQGYEDTESYKDALNSLVEYGESQYFDEYDDSYSNAVAGALDIPLYRPTEGSNVVPAYLKLENPLVFDMKGEDFDSPAQAAKLEEARAGGHDGLILRNYADGGDGGPENFQSWAPHDVYVVFEPGQIKSATGNQGTFDPANPDIRYSMDPEAASAFVVSQRHETAARRDDVVKALKDGPAGPLVDALMQNGTLRVTNMPPLSIIDRVGPAANRVGAIADHNGGIQLIANNITPGRETALLLHEALHEGGRSLYGDRRWNSLMKRLETMLDSQLTNQKAGRVKPGSFWDGVLRSLQHATENDPMMVGDRARLVEEFGAYTIEHYEQAPRGVRDWVNQVIGRIKEFLARTTGIQLGKITPAQMRALALASLRARTDVNRRFDTEDVEKPYFSMRPEDQHKDLDENGKKFFAKIGPRSLPKRLSDHWQELTDSLALRIRMAGVDRYGAFLRNDEALFGEDTLEGSIASSSWVLARMAKAAGGAMSSLLNHGRIYLDPDQKVIDMREGTDSLATVLRQLGDPSEINRFFGWVAANRANKLQQQGRENLFTPEEIKAGMEVNRGRTAAGKTRGTLYAKVWQEFQQIRDDVLSIADQTGLLKKAMEEPDALMVIAQQQGLGEAIVARVRKARRDQNVDDADLQDAAAGREGAALEDLRNLLETQVPDFADQMDRLTTDQKQLWMEEFYVPFYRVLGDESISGPGGSSGLSRQQAYRQLKGGTQHLNDLLENTLLNFHHLLQASLKNQAAQQAVENATRLGIAEESTAPVTKEDRKRRTWVMRDGNQVWYDISDPLTFKALSALQDGGLNNPLMRVGRAFKRFFTNMTTITPQFMIANGIRDTLSAIATSPASFNPVKNAMQGALTYGNDINKGRMLASGASFSFGHVYGNDANDIKISMTKELRQSNVISDPMLIPNTVLGAWRKWNDITDFAENINRAAIWQQNVHKGKLKAAFEARDLVDFGSTGDSVVIRALVDLVPFLNARIQGLDKLYRSGVKPGARTVARRGTAQDRRQFGRFMAVTGALAAVSLALYLRNWDDDEYRRLEDWQRDTYWVIRVGDNMFFVPKPFEVGAIATQAERLAEQFVDDSVGGRKYFQRLGSMFGDTFSFNPTPQAIMPMVELGMNESFFTGRPIEGLGMQRLSPSLRSHPYTTRLARETSRVIEALLDPIGAKQAALSPVQIDHLIQGYTGQVGTWAVGMGDALWRTALGEKRPERHWYEYQPIKRFYKALTDTDRYTRYGTLFYDTLNQVNRAYADLNEYIELGQREKALETRDNNRNMLQLRDTLNRMSRSLTEINQRMDQIERDPELSSEAKRLELDRLRSRRNLLMERAGKRIEEVKTKERTTAD